MKGLKNSHGKVEQFLHRKFYTRESTWGRAGGRGSKN